MGTNNLNAKKILSMIEKNKEKISEKGVKKIGLFGSFLKGKQKKNSDIDFLVEFKRINFEDYFEVIDILEKLLKRKIDLVIEKDLRPELNYVKEEVVYAKI